MNIPKHIVDISNPNEQASHAEDYKARLARLGGDYSALALQAAITAEGQHQVHVMRGMTFIFNSGNRDALSLDDNTRRNCVIHDVMYGQVVERKHIIYMRNKRIKREARYQCKR